MDYLILYEHVYVVLFIELVAHREALLAHIV